MTSRLGYTLIELLITMFVAAVIGTLLARMLVNDSRFVSKLEAGTEARQVARAALTTISIEAQMVDTVTEATETRIGFVVPFAWGVACGRDGGTTIGSIIPSDSMMMATATANRVYWLDANGDYQPAAAAVAPSTNFGACEDVDAIVPGIFEDSVRVLADSQLVAITMPDLMRPGSVFYLGELVRYEFRASTLLPGRWGLWREDGTGTWEELLAPFDTTSGFSYFIGISDTVNTNPPTNLSTVAGVELRLVGESQAIAEGASEPEEFVLDTRITFLNR
jgi:prepilin-type N-terminal cleavage/methylation domain-containing protein